MQPTAYIRQPCLIYVFANIYAAPSVPSIFAQLVLQTYLEEPGTSLIPTQREKLRLLPTETPDYN